MKKNNYIEFFRSQPKDKSWTTEQVLAILTGLSGSAKFTKKDLEWARVVIAAIPDWSVELSDTKMNEDMYKSYTHTRPFPKTEAPTERVIPKSQQKRRMIQEGTKKKGGINPSVSSSPRPPMRPGAQHITEGKIQAKTSNSESELD